MAVFNVPVVIGVNEEEIAKQIENEVRGKCIASINEEVKKIIFKEERDYYRTRNVTYSDAPLRKMVEREIEKTIDIHKDKIIEMAADKLADKLSRSKAVREKAAEVAEDVFSQK